MDHLSIRQLIFAKKNFLVIGAGRSGIAASRLLLDWGCKVFLYDDKDREQLRFFADADIKHEKNLITYFNEVEMPSINDVDAIILSPGIDSHHQLVKRAKDASLPVLNEIDLASIFLPADKMIGITGTNGKSTTTVMIESVLKAFGKNAIACGNLGLPLCDVIVNKNPDEIDYFVVELSSFQLEVLTLLKLSRAVITNITPDHLDRYKTFSAYKEAKYRIADLLLPHGQLFAHSSLSSEISSSSDVRFFSQNDFKKGDLSYLHALPILGLHNQENSVFAAAVGQSLGAAPEAIILGLKNFRPLPHRCEKVAIQNGITFINDSKGTTVASVKMALSMFKENKTHLLLGGIEKGEDFSSLGQHYFPQIAGYYVYGRDASKILPKLLSPHSYPCTDLRSALKKALENACPGDIVLLSPGCASYDQFKDYQHRGEMFLKFIYDYYEQHTSDQRLF